MSSTGMEVGIAAVVLVFAVIEIIAFWKVFTKANKPGWAAIIPIYNLWVAFEVAGKPGWWALLALIPYLGWLIVAVLEIIAFMEIAKRFGKSSAFGVIGLFIFGFIGWPILGFGSAQYNAPAAAPAQGTTPGATPPAQTV